MARTWSMITPLLVLATAYATEPKARVADPTLLVTNTTCDTGPCVPLRVKAQPRDWAVPCPELGGCYRDVGIVAARTACLRLPDSLTAQGINLGPRGDTLSIKTIRWTSASALDVWAETDSAVVWGATFVPGGSPGWEIALPGAAQGSPPTASAGCTPE